MAMSSNTSWRFFFHCNTTSHVYLVTVNSFVSFVSTLWFLLTSYAANSDPQIIHFSSATQMKIDIRFRKKHDQMAPSWYVAKYCSVKTNLMGKIPAICHKDVLMPSLWLHFRDLWLRIQTRVTLRPKWKPDREQAHQAGVWNDRGLCRPYIAKALPKQKKRIGTGTSYSQIHSLFTCFVMLCTKCTNSWRKFMKHLISCPRLPWRTSFLRTFPYICATHVQSKYIPTCVCTP